MTKVNNYTTILTIMNFMERTNEFRCNAKLVDFIYIFGEDMGDHFWRKFYWQYDHNIYRLYFTMDLKWQRIFCRAIINGSWEGNRWITREGQ